MFKNFQKWNFYKPVVSDVEEMIEIQKKAYIKNYLNEKHGATIDQILSDNWEIRKTDRIQQLQSDCFLWIALKNENGMIGYRSLGDLDKNIVHLYNIIVDPDFQKLDYGKIIVDYLLRNTPEKRIELETTVTVEFYKKFGFQSQKKDSHFMFLTPENLFKYKSNKL